ncbi:uncharacterized protein LOC134294224 [Anolis carolinensis]|uniref:uncharacterized protein LOC134294224 n=1 Tax=Anolis carolinensis TaxID=28377 RepID=UPI002F2B85CC
MASWERGLARAVAHRLKYYIDVQRKEDSFTSCGVIHADSESLYGKPACLTDQKEHDFSNIKLEASLRAFMGTAEDCHRKLRKAPEKQKDLENRIKKMAQSYVPERRNEGKVKNVRWQKGLHRASQKSLHRTATPFMSPEEVERLVSSASKLIVATISEIPPEKPRTTPEDASFLKRRDVKSIQTSDNSIRQQFSSTLSCKDGARRAKQERKSREDVKRTGEFSSIPSNSAKSKRFLSEPRPKPTARSSLNRGSLVSSFQTGENKARWQSKLKSKASISEHKDKTTLNAQEKTRSLSEENPHDSGGRFNKTEREDSRSPRPGEIASSKAKGLDPRPVLRSPKNKKSRVSKSDNTKYSAEPTTAAISTQLSMTGKKMEEQGNSIVVSRCVAVPGYGASEYNQVYYEKNQQGYIPGGLAQEYHCSDGGNLHHLRVPEDAALAPAVVDKPTGHVACVQEDRNGPVATLKHGSSFLYELCQEMDQDSPADMLTNRSVTTDETDGNQSTHSCLNPP